MSRVEKRKFLASFIAAVGAYGFVVGILLALNLPSKAVAPWAGKEGAATFQDVLSLLTVPAFLGIGLGIYLILRQARPSRTVLRVVEDRMAMEKERLANELYELRQNDAREMEEWKSETLGKLYEMIIDQVERGLINCGKCSEIANVRREKAQYSNEHASGGSGMCECGGPTSLTVSYLPPPRRHSNTTAS
ncbi:hypothetical protein [Streptomyces sp. ECR3.8]|uniref:hypothetical protein n=1 Tax=Streptomyces sp. ECR3.8 TaxID=3461009 RepID=UPI0040433001